MKAKNDSLRVSRYGIGLFLVHSENPRSEMEYLVTFDEPGFPLGACSCEDFQIRIESIMFRGLEPYRFSCKHVRRCRQVLAHAKRLCRRAGLTFSESIIPMHS